MDVDGKVVLRNDTQGAFRPTEEKRLTSSLEVVQELLDARFKLKQQPDDAAAGATRKILEAILEISSTSTEELDQLATTEGISPEVQQRFRRWRSIQPVAAVLKDYVNKIRGIPREDQSARSSEFKAAASKMLALHRSGLVLEDPRHGIFSDYWRLVFEGALTDQDLEIAGSALATYRKAFGSRPELRNRIDLMASRLGALRKSLEQDAEQEIKPGEDQ